MVIKCIANEKYGIGDDRSRRGQNRSQSDKLRVSTNTWYIIDVEIKSVNQHSTRAGIYDFVMSLGERGRSHSSISGTLTRSPEMPDQLSRRRSAMV